jgi:hypothetical protein
LAGSPKKRARREAAAQAAAQAQAQAEGAPLPSAAAPVAMKANVDAGIVRRVSQPMTDELFAEVCERVANGSSTLKISKEEGMPARSTMECWIDETEERREAYEKARKRRGDYRFEMIDAIVAKISEGTLEANAGRVMIEAIKWQAAKENPRAYGDKIEHVGKDGAALFPELIITYGSTTVVNHITPPENPESEAR